MCAYLVILTVCLMISQRKVKGDRPCTVGSQCQLNKNSDQADDERPVKTLSDQLLHFTNSLLRTSQIADPIHQVLGREGETGEGDQYRVRLDGSLMLLNWETSQATGFYFCTMTHTRYQEEHSLTLRFCLVAYHLPFRSLHVGAQLKTTTCEQHYVKNSVTSVKSVLGSLCEQLSCEISNSAFDCTQWGTSSDTMEHHIQLNVTVQSQGEDVIIPCKTGQECHSEEILRKAYESIRAFTTQSRSILEASNNVPPLYYVEGTFKAMKMDHCLAGMGKLSGRRSPCVDCCVTCGPGSYSPNWTSICIPCPINYYQHMFGRTQCQACPVGLRTNGEGAVSSTDCNNNGIQGRLLDIDSKVTRREKAPEKAAEDRTAPAKDGQILRSTHLLVTIVVCSLAFLGATVLTIYCLVTLLCKEAIADRPVLRVKQNANLKSIKSSPYHLAMREDQNNNWGTWIK
ncbi:zona pellucida-binding protein 1-like isoform X2 [Heptranchias perlo]|uniref:zona pellucida-binding protein 1-like isoform X2 n=1 Tax=Heptranchias perlo TaxID=212740 RepID=UPI00355981DA